MKVLYIALIASLLMACNNSSDKTTTKASTVGALALNMIETQTTDEGAPLDINAIEFKSEERVDEYIDADF